MSATGWQMYVLIALYRHPISGIEIGSVYGPFPTAEEASLTALNFPKPEMMKVEKVIPG